MNVLLKNKEFNSCIIRKISSDNKNLKITPVQCEIIKYLIDNENIFQKDIEVLLKLRRSTISGILHTMEKNGLISKTANENDFRTRKITLTDKALKLYNSIDLKFRKLNDEICNGISKEELNIYFNVIDKMITNLRRDD